MQKLVRKIVALSIVTLSITFSSISYGEPEIKNEDPVEIGNSSVVAVDDLLLTFMIKSQVLAGLADNFHEDICYFPFVTTIHLDGTSTCIATAEEFEAVNRRNEALIFQFRTLYNQLTDRLENLAKSEKEVLESTDDFLEKSSCRLSILPIPISTIVQFFNQQCKWTRCRWLACRKV